MQEKDLMRLIGQRIRSARKSKGLSQVEFAGQIGKDQRSVSQYENGDRGIWVSDLFLFAQILDVPPTYFIEIDKPLSDGEVLLLKRFNRLPTDESKQSALELLRVFTDTFTE